MKSIIVVLLSLPILTSIGGLVKYNVQLNNFIKQENNHNVEKSITSAIHRTEVHIVGTVHFETDSIKRHHFYNYLESISPSVILYEGYTHTVKHIVNKTDYFSRVIDGLKNRKEMEKFIVLKYLENNSDCVLLPYEWELRSEYHRKYRLRKKSKEMINSVIGLYRDSLLTKNQTAIIDEFLEFNNALIKIDNGTISDINNLTTDSILKQRQHYIYKEIPRIAKDKKELVEYLDFIPIHMSYWDTRNKAMAQNILKQIKNHPNKTIVVLNGFYHRYYLIEELKPYQTQYGFVLNP